jgi:hypothetical protein
MATPEEIAKIFKYFEAHNLRGSVTETLLADCKLSWEHTTFEVLMRSARRWVNNNEFIPTLAEMNRLINEEREETDRLERVEAGNEANAELVAEHERTERICELIRESESWPDCEACLGVGCGACVHIGKQVPEGRQGDFALLVSAVSETLAGISLAGAAPSVSLLTPVDTLGSAVVEMPEKVRSA